MGIVLWDVDGTLVDSASLHKAKIVSIAGDPLSEASPFIFPRGVKITDKNWDDVLYGKADRLVYEWIKAQDPAYPLSLKTFIDKCEEYFADNASTLKARAGALEAFNIWAANGYSQAAVSSGTRQGINASLKTIGVLDRLVLTIAEGDTPKSKPDPEPYNVAFARIAAFLKQAGIPVPVKSQSRVIEDSYGGAKAGGTSGIPTVFWKDSPAKADSPDAAFNLCGAQAMIDLAQSMAKWPGATSSLRLG